MMQLLGFPLRVVSDGAPLPDEHRVTGGPPASATFFSESPVKNPIQSPSGEKNG